MSENIKGKLIQDGIPTPDNPCEIKTILCNDIEIPVEFLEQNVVTVDGKKYIELQQENQQLKEKVGELTQSLNEQMKETNKENLDCSKYAIENKQLKDKIKQLEKCYCNRSDCSGRIKDSRKYDSVVQQLDKYKEVIDKATKFYTHELFKREQLPIPENMPWESAEMFNILEGNK